MASFKSHPFFYTSLILIGAVTAGEAWLLFSQSAEVSKLSAAVEQKQQELQAIGRKNPFPSSQNVAAVEADLAVAQQTRAGIRTTLRATSEIANQLAAASVPASKTDAYFDLANYVERIRAAATAAKVALPTDDRLGFSLYARTGPEIDLIGPVFRQRQYADYLMNVVLAAKPREFLSLQRERPLSAAQRQQNEAAVASGQPLPVPPAAEGGDFFVIDPRTSARVSGFVETSPFRLSFIGTTASLRSVLNRLATFELPVVVRSVEVEPLNRQDSGAAARPAPAPSNPFAVFGGDDSSAVPAQAEVVTPLVQQSDSRFVVTVEFISLVEKKDPAAEVAAVNP